MASKGGKAGGRNAGVTIIRREEVIAGGHHGGAWKVAYADFVTAMMAFFLLMWLLNATTEDQRKGLADYFSPNNLMSHASSGTGQPFGGHTVFDTGGMVSDRGAAQVLVGKRPVVEDPADDDADTQPAPSSHGAAAQAGPVGKLDAGTPGSAKMSPADPDAANPEAANPLAANPLVTNQLATDRRVATPGTATPGTANPVVATLGEADQGATGPAAAGSQAARSDRTGPGRVGSTDATQSSAVMASAVVARLETPAGTSAPTEAQLQAAQERREKLVFQQAAEQLRQAVQGDPALAGLSRQLAIDITPEGLRIQLLDEDRLPMFATGSATPNDRVQMLLAKVAPVLMRLPEDIAVVGHTDAKPFVGTGKTNWELSTERANATRRLLTDAGLAEARISRVTGLADRDALLPADPLAAANRRIAIIVLRSPRRPAAPAAPSPAVSPVLAPVPAPAPRSGSLPP
jgi:chemotaxis protein MotB